MVCVSAGTVTVCPLTVAGCGINGSIQAVVPGGSPARNTFMPASATVGGNAKRKVGVEPNVTVALAVIDT